MKISERTVRRKVFNRGPLEIVAEGMSPRTTAEFPKVPADLFDERLGMRFFCVLE
jgi:hypothetical protein